METGFLTNFRVPKMRGDQIIRPRLMAALSKATEKRLTVVTAPAAYGKTTLLAQFCQQCSRPVCWYTAEPTDADVTTFLCRLYASIKATFPTFPLLPGIAAPGASSVSTDALIVGLVNGLHDLRGGAVLVWDDFHHLAGNPEIVAAIDRFVAHLPEECAVLIGARTTLPFPSLGKMLTYRNAAAFSSDDLCFTQEETHRLLNVLQGGEAPLAVAQQLQEKSGGWLGGILALQGRPGQKDLSELSTIEAEDYFTEITLQSIPELHRWLFKATSVFPYLTAGLFSTVFPLKDCEAILQAAYEKTGYLSKIGAPGTVYKWHELIREGMERLLRNEDPALYAAIAEKGAQALREKGEIDYAVTLLFKANAVGKLSDLLLQEGEGFIRAGKWKLFQGWLNKLPSQTLEFHPQLLEFMGRLATRLGAKEQAIEHFSHAIRAASALGDTRLCAHVQTARSGALRLLGYEREAEADARAAVVAFEALPDAERDLMRALRQLAMIYLYQGRYQEAETWLLRAWTMLPRHPDEHESALLSAALGWAYVELGRVGEAQNHLDKAIHRWRNMGNKADLAVSLNNLSLLWYRHGDLEKARKLLLEALGCTQEIGYTRFEAIVVVGLGDVERDYGNLEKALEWYDRGLALAGSASEANLVTYATAVMGDTYRLLGETTRAEMLLSQATHLGRTQNQFYESAMTSMYLALLAATQDDFAQAQSYLAGARTSLQQTGNAQAKALFALYSAEVAFLGKDLKSAKTHLEALFEQCTTLGYDGFLNAEAQRAPAVFAWAAANGICGQFYRQFLREVSQSQEIGGLLQARGRLSLHLRAYAFGKPRVYLGDEPIAIETWQSPKAKELFFYLLANQGPVAKERILADVWPDVRTDLANNHFHSSMYRLRNAIHPAAVMFDKGGYAINPDLNMWFDLTQFFDKVRQAEGLTRGTKQRASALEEALEVCSGPVLEEFYAEWAETIRRHTDGVYLRALSSLAGFYSAQQDFSRALKLLERASQYDHLQEGITLEIMRCHIAVGDALAAVQVYEQYRDLVSTEMGEEPSSDMQRLATDARRRLAR